MTDIIVILYNNKPYGIDTLSSLALKKTKTMKLNIDTPFSITIDSGFIKWRFHLGTKKTALTIMRTVSTDHLNQKSQTKNFIVAQ